jgi:uncharacterized membrane protein YdjX (TVP38/TMEM64 family)
MKFFPILFLFAIVVLFYFFFGFDYLSVEAISRFQSKLEGGSIVYAVFLFAFFYVGYAVSSMPGLLLLDVVSGMLFGQFLGFLIAWLSALTGAVIVFLSVSYAVSDLSIRKNQTFIKRVEAGFQKHSLNYLLFLRIIPFMPFGLVNITLGFLKVHMKSFIWTTLVGILPLSFFYTHAGAGISDIISNGEAISIGTILNRYVVLSLGGLGLLTLLPILIKRRDDKVAN